MKLFYVLALMVLLLGCCPSKRQVDSMYILPNFCYNVNRTSGTTYISVCAIIDSTHIKAMFDTGCPGLVLDNSIAERLPYLDSIRLSGGMTIEDVYFPYSGRCERWKLYRKKINVEIEGETIRYENFFTAEIRQDYGADAIVPIPESDSHIWNISFEDCRIDLCTREEDLLGNGMHDLEMFLYFNEGKLCIKGFPLKLAGVNDTLPTIVDLIVDTGTYSISMALICNRNQYKEERDFLEKNAILTYEQITSEKVYHIKESGIINDTTIISYIETGYGFNEAVAGLGLLSRFDITLDIGRRKAYFRRNSVEKDFYEYAQDHGASYSGIVMIPLKKGSAAVAIDVGREMPSYKAGLRNYDIVTHLGNREFSDSYAQRYFKEHRDSIITLKINRLGEEKDISFCWDLKAVIDTTETQHMLNK